MEYLYDSLTTAVSLATTSSIGIYLERAPETADFPYITFSLSGSRELEAREDHFLDVDLWENIVLTTDPTFLDVLERAVDGNGSRSTASGLDGLKYYSSSENLAARIYRETRLMVPDPDEAIRRRRLRYRVLTFDATTS